MSVAARDSCITDAGSPMLPTILSTLAVLLSRSGYSTHLRERGGRDAIRVERHDSLRSTLSAVDKVEERFLKRLKHECGPEWCDVFGRCRAEQIRQLQSASRRFNFLDSGVTPFRARPAIARFERRIGMRWFAEVTRYCGTPLPLSWFERPVGAWIDMVTNRLGVDRNVVLDALTGIHGVPMTTVARWDGGVASPRSLDASRAKVSELCKWASGKPVRGDEVRRLTGWLVLARATQDIGLRERRRLSRELVEDTAADDVLENLRQSLDALPARRVEVPFVRPNTPESRFRNAWNDARVSVDNHRPVEAIRHFCVAIELAWGYAGPCQEQLLREALVYASNIKADGAQVLARECWTGLQLLGVNRWGKPLDAVEKQRLAISFDREYENSRIPGPVNALARHPFVDGVEGDTALRPRDLKNPNSLKRSFGPHGAETPVMKAIRLGCYTKLHEMLDNPSTDLDVTVPHTDETALSAALERARSTGETCALYAILDRPLALETVTHPFGSERLTPLELAMDLGELRAVRSLLAKGINPNASTSRTPNALVYALTLLAMASDEGLERSRETFLQVGDGASPLDATYGADTDDEARRLRRTVLDQALAQPYWRDEYERAHREWTLPKTRSRALIDVLIEANADPNRIHRPPHAPTECWTPTLVAVDTGDLEGLKRLVKGGGNPWHDINRGGPGPVMDGRELASAFGYTDIVEWLKTPAVVSLRARSHGTCTR